MMTITITEYLANKDAYKDVKELKITGAAPRDCTELFSELTSCEVLDLSELDTSAVENMSYMFNWCFRIEKIDLSKFNTHKVEFMDGMFSECWDLKEIKGLESFDITCLKSAKYMFNDCRSLEDFDASAIEAANINKKHMFRNCNRR